LRSQSGVAQLLPRILPEFQSLYEDLQIAADLLNEAFLGIDGLASAKVTK
jgi:hypothetical protein